ncbi:predicted protein [Sclerotinia sclerotiorum 1980 UF-70]|uniref:Uncharacterized protein n=1 Tax=Sclerotinia sclerotiorum (strain ATCC 18683 / 1980 / Ss-1) TaxID=665079 RepID=A7EHS3_SCLS1|nr:predicted protein [Sclerotinia sclerotiorum 1980 UF-70]EDO02389.1 predicted protein [Sclerotinia sclerotiorum 1980 UF-70]
MVKPKSLDRQQSRAVQIDWLMLKPRGVSNTEYLDEKFKKYGVICITYHGQLEQKCAALESEMCKIAELFFITRPFRIHQSLS